MTKFSIIIDMLNVDKILSSKWILASNNDSLLKDYSIAIEGNIIKEILPTKEVKKKYVTNNHQILKSHILVPGLVNNGISSPHTLSSAYLRSNISNKKIKMTSKKYLDLSTKITISQLIKNGVTTFTDTSNHPDIVFKQAIKSGIRGNIGLPILSCKTHWACKEQEYFKKSIEFFDEYRDNPSTKIYLNLGGIDMLSKSGFEKVSKIISELNVPVRMNLHDNLNQINAFKKKYKQRPIKFLENLGLLSDIFTAINPFYMTKSDINIMKRYKSHIVHTPIYNIINQNMKCDTKLFLKNGIKVSLGTGDYVSDITKDLFNELRIVSLLSKLNKNKEDHLTQKDLLGLIMHNSSVALGLNFNMGKIKKKYSADIISIKVNQITASNLNSSSFFENEISSANIDNVWVSGKQILKNKKLLTINENMLYDEFTELIN